MLSDITYKNILSRLDDGVSYREIASLLGVSTYSVWKVSRERRHSCTRHREGIEPSYVKTEPVRCRICGSLVVLSPCPACHARTLTKPTSSVSSCGTSLGVDLHGEEKRRYLEIRHKVENQIAAGRRRPLDGLLFDSN